MHIMMRINMERCLLFKVIILKLQSLGSKVQLNTKLIPIKNRSSLGRRKLTLHELSFTEEQWILYLPENCILLIFFFFRGGERLPPWYSIPFCLTEHNTFWWVSLQDWRDIRDFGWVFKRDSHYTVLQTMDSGGPI